MKRRELGIYAFRTPPGHFGRMSGWYSMQMERGDADGISRQLHPEETMVGCPYYPWLEEDLSPKKMWETEILSPFHKQHWMSESIDYFTTRIITKGKRVFDELEIYSIREDYCPVCWRRMQMYSLKELTEKVEHIVMESGLSSIPLYYLAVSYDSTRGYGMSMPVVWMRYSFLRRFKVGQDIINVYRMMKRSDKVYGIPLFPFPQSFPI